MLRRSLRLIVLGLLRLFYPRVEVQNRERLPQSAPVIYVLNHPNGLLDPLLLIAQVQRPTAFLAAAYLFRMPVIKWFVGAFGALPVYRQNARDAGAGAAEPNADRNEATFARCRALLRGGGALALFPEGTTHSAAQLLPLRSGAARIALSAEHEAGWQLGIQVVPVSLWYEQKTVFRTGVLLVVGEPFGLAGYEATYASDSRAAIHALTNAIDHALDGVVLQAETRELLQALPVVASWTAPAGLPLTLAQRRTHAAVLLHAYEQLQHTDPARLAALTAHARRYARTLRKLGVNYPWALETGSIRQSTVLRRVLWLVVAAPFSALGFVSNYGPYRLAGLVASRVIKHEEAQIGHAKLMVGAGLLPLGWLLIALIAGWVWGVTWGVLAFVALPLLGYLALRWGEGWHDLQPTLEGSWLRGRHGALATELIARRRTLTAEIMAAVEAVEGAQPVGR